MVSLVGHSIERKITGINPIIQLTARKKTPRIIHSTRRHIATKITRLSGRVSASYIENIHGAGVVVVVLAVVVVVVDEDVVVEVVVVELVVVDEDDVVELLVVDEEVVELVVVDEDVVDELLVVELELVELELVVETVVPVVLVVVVGCGPSPIHVTIPPVIVKYVPMLIGGVAGGPDVSALSTISG